MTIENHIKTKESQKKNTMKRALAIKHLVDEYFRPAEHLMCYKNIWRKYVHPQFGISYRTLIRMLHLAFTVEPFIGIGQNYCIVKDCTIIHEK